MDIAMSRVDLPDRRIFTGFARDITDRKRAEQATRDFGGRLLQAQEAERARLARELHDDITQRLARLAIDASRADSGPDTRNGSIRDLREGLVRLSEDIHTLSYRLHPSMLGDLGLAASLKAECERFSQQTSITTGVKLGELPTLIPPDAALTLFRIAQEALRNVARHASSKVAAVALRPLDNGLQLAVTDNGIGFDPRGQRARPSLGLASMRERVRLLGGELDIESAPGQGTTILAWVPLKEES
jgi:signal transduction histidine kinase